MGLFSNLNNQGKSIELEKLLNETIWAIYDLEKNKSRDRAILTATIIKNNAYEIVCLYGELIKASNKKNILVKNKILPSEFPAEFAVMTGIQTIFESASEIVAEFPMFKEAIISQEVFAKYSALTYPF